MPVRTLSCQQCPALCDSHLVFEAVAHGPEKHCLRSRPSLLPQHCVHRKAHVVLNSSHRAYKTSPLPTEPSPSPRAGYEFSLVDFSLLLLLLFGGVQRLCFILFL